MLRRVRGIPPPGDFGLSGDYSAWQDAVRSSTGYDSQSILEATRAAVWKVKNGEAAFERDSVVFDRADYSWPVLSGLMLAAAHSGGNLNVLDLGGSLGSTYFQNRAFLSSLPEVRWNVVEQPAHVAVGKSDFENDTLRFFGSIAECISVARPNVALLSSVLQYVERPYALLDQIMSAGTEYLIVDRSPFWAGSNDRLCVQTVPPSIYAASYPSWIFSQPRFESFMLQNWSIVAAFENSDWMRAPVEMAYKGFIMSRSGSRP